MNVWSLVISIVIGIALVLVAWWFSNNFVLDEDGQKWVRLLGVVIAIPIIAIGCLEAFGLAEEKYNVTLKFIDTGTVVCYEDARIVYGDHHTKTLVTSDGQRITIVNAEVTVEKVEE